MKYYGYKFKLMPQRSQQASLLQDFGNIRFVYNYYLNRSIQDYQQDEGMKRNKYEYIKDIVNLKKENKRLKLSNSQSLQSALGDLDTAYNRFFKGGSKFPKFKKRSSKQSMHIPQFFKIEGNKVKIPKYNWMKFKKHREIEGKIKSLTISKDTTGLYYLSILVEKDIEKLPSTGKEAGVDLGIKDLAITSDGKVYATKKYDDTKIRRLQMWKSKKKPGSRRYRQLKAKIARLHKRNANIRENYLHHISKDLVSQYDFIALENLNVAGMMKNRKLSYSIGQQGRNKLVTMIEYKAEWYGKITHKINRRYPSSKQCFECGNVKKHLTLKERIYRCSECGACYDRDIGAAKNILAYAQRELKF